jgi:hypothetical protein
METKMQTSFQRLDVKGALSSKTVWAGIVTMAASALGCAGYVLSAADQASLVDGLTSLVTLVSGAAAIYGRVVASKQIRGV